MAKSSLAAAEKRVIESLKPRIKELVGTGMKTKAATLKALDEEIEVAASNLDEIHQADAVKAKSERLPTERLRR